MDQDAIKKSFALALRWIKTSTTSDKSRWYLKYHRDQGDHEKIARHAIVELDSVLQLSQAAASAAAAPTINSEYKDVLGRLLTYYRAAIVTKNDAGGDDTLTGTSYAHLDTRVVREPASVGHNGVLIACIASESRGNNSSNDKALIRNLAEGICRKQRDDGCFKLHFEPETRLDFRMEQFSGQALLGLVLAAKHLSQPSFLEAAEQGLLRYKAIQATGRVQYNDLPLFSHWHNQVVRSLLLDSRDHAVRQAALEYALHMSDLLVNFRFFQEAQQLLPGIRSIDVAYGLSSMAEAYHIASEVGDTERRKRYYATFAQGLQFLDACQVKPEEGEAIGAVGGFKDVPHKQRKASQVQRLHTAVHAVGAYTKLMDIIDKGL